MNYFDGDVKMPEFFSMWLKHAAISYRRFKVNRMIVANQFHQDSTRLSIEQLRETQRYLQTELMHLKAERNTLN